MDNDSIRRAITFWARSKPLIERVYVFGSRARYDYRSDSDLDIAVELDLDAVDGTDDSGGWAVWSFETEGWKEELQSAIPHNIDLQQFLEGKTPVIAQALKQSSYLVYQKQRTSTKNDCGN